MMITVAYLILSMPAFISKSIPLHKKYVDNILKRDSPIHEESIFLCIKISCDVFNSYFYIVGYFQQVFSSSLEHNKSLCLHLEDGIAIT